jgi:hypothetical protein
LDEDSENLGRRNWKLAKNSGEDFEELRRRCQREEDQEKYKTSKLVKTGNRLFYLPYFSNLYSISLFYKRYTYVSIFHLAGIADCFEHKYFVECYSAGSFSHYTRQSWTQIHRTPPERGSLQCDALNLLFPSLGN